MAATFTLDHSAQSRNSAPNFQPIFSTVTPRNGVVTLYGYGIKVRLERGHLAIEDGICENRRAARLSRVGHGLRRLVVIGSDGMISLAALRWLADQDASFVMLERNGRVLATTGPVRPSDAKLRRAQSLACQTGADIKIARYLIEHKLAGQERVARERLGNASVAECIAAFRDNLQSADSINAIRSLESKGAMAYWAAWENLPVTFPTKDLPRVPEHWRLFGARRSPITGSQRLAVNPPNAMLNYLYAILEAESRLAAAALGLDPGIGFIHVDTPNRDSLACDLMEAVRPQVDGFVLDWIRKGQLKREWFFEERNGNCRLMASLAEKLSETATTWGRAVAPYAEWIARTLWQRTSRRESYAPPATRLTNRRRSEGRGHEYQPQASKAIQHENLCYGCGATIGERHSLCRKCSNGISQERMLDIARAGRAVSHTLEAEAKRAETRRRNAKAQAAWKPSDNPSWLTDETYKGRIQPRLTAVAMRPIASALGVSQAYASHIQRGLCIPHPRHWLALARLAGIPQ